MRRFFAVVLLLIFGLSILCGFRGVYAGDVYDVGLQEFAWNHTTLSVLIVASENKSWWSSSFVDDARRAIGQWNDSIHEFAADYPEFSYLSKVVISWDVSNDTRQGYDLYFSWVQSSLSNSSDEVGLAKTFVNNDNSMLNCSIQLAAQTNHGTALRPIDMQNIALHELGHGLGLGHSNFTGDVMYSIYTLESGPLSVSTLDAYGVARVFGWIPNPSSFRPVSKWLNVSFVSLPPEISYEGLPISSQNMPPQSLLDNPVVQFFVLVFGVLAEPIIAVPLLLVIFVFVVLMAYPRRKKHMVPVSP